jgi:hypothetical protein
VSESTLPESGNRVFQQNRLDTGHRDVDRFV